MRGGGGGGGWRGGGKGVGGIGGEESVGGRVGVGDGAEGTGWFEVGGVGWMGHCVGRGPGWWLSEG